MIPDAKKIILAISLIGMPPVTDAEYLPSHEVCQRLMSFYQSRFDYLRSVPANLRDEDKLQYADWQLRVWSSAAEATGPLTSYRSKQLSLRVIRTLVGYDAYYRHDLP